LTFACARPSLHSSSGQGLKVVNRLKSSKLEKEEEAKNTDLELDFDLARRFLQALQIKFE
jgi:hypothetical protein